MFIVDPATKKITMHRGDTGEVTFTATGHTYGSDDRALFTLKSPQGVEVFRQYYQMTDNAFVVEFTNPMTDHLAPGLYKYDVRYIVDPTWEGQGDAAEITDGDVVSTPGSPFVLELLPTVGQI